MRSSGPLRLGGDHRACRCAACDPARRTPSRSLWWHHPVHVRAMCVIVRDLIVYGVLRGHDARPSCRRRDVPRGSTRSDTTGGSSVWICSRSCASPPGSCRLHRPCLRRFAPDALRSSSLGIMARPRARRSNSETVTASTTSYSGVRSTSARRTKMKSPVVMSSMLDGRARGGGRPWLGAWKEEQSRGRTMSATSEVVVLGSGKSWPRAPDGRAGAGDTGGDRRAPPRAPTGSPSTPPRRLAARPLLRARRRRARRQRHPLPRAGSRRGRRPARALLTPRTASTCSAPTASSTSATSWSAASTTPTSTRAAPSRS